MQSSRIVALWNFIKGHIRPHGGIVFSGAYPSWDAAMRESKGYGSPEILEITRRAMLKIKNGEAAYERDSVIFDRPAPPFPLICGLLRAASLSGNRLNVVDFGGALGSSYFQCRPFLDGVANLRWNVIEQAGHVACGNAEFADEALRFHSTVMECLTAETPNVLIVSAVLQYLPSPYEELRALLGHRIPHVLADRTAFLRRDQDRLTIQHVPDSIYPASYPAWFFSRSKFMACFRPGYRLVYDFPGSDRAVLEGDDSFFEGLVFERDDSELAGRKA